MQRKYGVSNTSHQYSFDSILKKGIDVYCHEENYSFIKGLIVNNAFVKNWEHFSGNVDSRASSAGNGRKTLKRNLTKTITSSVGNGRPWHLVYVQTFREQICCRISSCSKVRHLAHFLKFSKTLIWKNHLRTYFYYP